MADHLDVLVYALPQAISHASVEFSLTSRPLLLGVMLICALVNIFGAKYLDYINKICIYWTAASVVIILITLLSTADARRSGAFVFGHFDASASGWPGGWAFFVGLLQAAYTLTGYGMVASMCEEVQQPQREVPRAMVLSVAAAGITGVVYLVPILFVLPDVALLLGVSNGQPIGLLFKTITGSAAGGFGLLFLSTYTTDPAVRVADLRLPGLADRNVSMSSSWDTVLCRNRGSDGSQQMHLCIFPG